MNDSNSLNVDVFYSMRSPYSYIATYKMKELSKKYNVKFNIRFVYPIAIRIKGFFDKIDPLFPIYLKRDCIRVSEMKNIPFKWPTPDPIVMDYPNVAKEQPYIYRITRLGVLASLYDKDLQYVCNVSKLIWDGNTIGWDKDNYLKKTLESIALDLGSMEKEIIDREEELEQIILKNENDLRATGHWGVPLFGFKNEPFFGQDRIDLLLWRLKQHGLKEK